MNYTNGDNIDHLVIEGEILWIGTGGGLVKYNIVSEEYTFYNKANSGLPHNHINFIFIDKDGTKWIGTRLGLAEFDGTNYEYKNLLLISSCIEIFWIGTNSGLVKFEDDDWIVFVAYNSNPLGKMS